MTWPTSNPIARELDEFWQQSQPLQQQWWYEADIDTKFATGQQDYANTYGTTNYRNQKQLQFNKILRIINMIGGYQRKNRLASVVIPADGTKDDGEVSDDLTTCLDWCFRQDSTYEKISHCFDGSNTCGLNLLSIWMDHREDPENGKICTDRLPFSSFIMDPYWTKPDLSDCTRIWTRRYLQPRELLSLYPSIKRDLPYLGKGKGPKDGKFQFLAQNWYQYATDLYAYDEYWVKDYKKKRKLLNKQSGEVLDWNGTKEQFMLLRRFNPNIDMITATVPTIKLHCLVNNQLVYEEVSPWGLDRLPFAPSVCYHFPEVQNYGYRYQGVVRNIRDSQVELNRRRNRLLDVLDAQIQSGLMLKEDALVNPEDAFFQGPGKILFFKQTANLATDAAPIPPPPVAQGWMELIQTLDSEIMSIVGTPEELYGENLDAKEMSGVLMQLKMGAGLTSLQNIFDNLNTFQKSVSEIFVNLIQNNFSEGKVGSILGHAPSEQFADVYQSQFTCAIEEAELTTTQRQLQFIQALHLKQLGVPISNKYILQKSTLQGKKDIIADIEAQEKQANEMAQAQQQAELQQTQMMARSLEAKAQSDFAGAEERLARAVSDIALAQERSAMAANDRSKAVLDQVRAMKEIQELDHNRLQQLSHFLMDMQLKQKELASVDGAATAAAVVGEKVDRTEAASNPSAQPQQAG